LVVGGAGGVPKSQPSRLRDVPPDIFRDKLLPPGAHLWVTPSPAGLCLAYRR
jgi:hypothetical protein